MTNAVMVANSTDAVMITVGGLLISALVAVTLLICAAATLLPLIALALPIPGLIVGRRGRLRLSPLKARRPTGAARAGPALRCTKQRQSKNRDRDPIAHLSFSLFSILYVHVAHVRGRR
jgi:hypothetical protein